MPPPHMFNPLVPFTESLFSLVIIILCLIIYFKTKEVSNLTKYRGIEYFRRTFLFLALSYLFRFFSRIPSIIFDIPHYRAFFMLLGLIFVSFFSTMAIISLFLSISWKHIRWRYVDVIAPIVALLVSISAFFTREPLILILSQAFLLILTAILSFRVHKKSNKFSKLFTTYVLLFLFWIIGLFPLSTRCFFPGELVIFIHIIAFIIFLLIFYKVKKWVK